MRVDNALMPNPDQLRLFLSTSADAPLVMVNLLTFKSLAEYPDGRDPDLSGVDAYLRYAVAVQSCLRQVGGRALYSGPVAGLLLGHVEEPWDMVALAYYPNAAAMLEMVALPDYRDIEVHRLAGLKGQLNIRTTPALLGL